MAGDALAGLLGRVAAGDQAAFAALYERCAGRLFAIALRIVRDRAIAEAVLQQAFTAIWQRAREFDPAHGDALAWTIAIVRACAIDAVRSRPRDLNLQPGETVFDGLEGRIELSGLRRCLGEIAGAGAARRAFGLSQWLELRRARGGAGHAGRRRERSGRQRARAHAAMSG